MDAGEGDRIVQRPKAELVRGVADGELVAPMAFGGHIYAWSREDGERLQRDAAGCVVTARPYTALLLSGFIERLVPVWIDVSEEERMRRLTMRGSSRDRDPSLGPRRLAQDSEDIEYQSLFPVIVESDDRAAERIRQVLVARPHRIG